jgi:serine/threonine protein kinase
MARLRNPNILLCMGACTEEQYGENNYAIVMEYMPRGDLHSLLHNPAVHLSLPKKIQFAIDIAKGMAWLAAQNILHRDLKPANVLLDKNWICKICDFGLSQVTKTRKKIQDSDEAPGSVLWMAPEVLLGEKIDEKLDVYAFALVFWEILTRKDLFAEYDDKEIFTEDIARKGIRPLLTEIHSVLKEIIVRCWDRNPDFRPSFEQVLPMLEKALIQIYLPSTLCPLAPIFWEKNFKQLARVHIDVFVPSLIKTLKPVTKKSQTIKEESCLKALLEEEDGDEKVVSIERFGALLTWFGRMKIDKFTILDRVLEVMSSPWFFGMESSQQVERRIAVLQTKPRGTFLVRLNTGERTPIDKAPFTITRVGDDGKVVHTRVYTNKKGGLTIKPNEGETITSKGTSIRDFVALIQTKNATLLTVPCPGWPFEHIFAATPIPRSAYDEAGDEDLDA